MMSIFGESEKLGRLVSAGRIECSPGFVGPIASEADSGKQLAVKFFRASEILHPQIDVIEDSCSHFFDFRFSRRIINFNPDQVSSTAQTFVSTRPSGSATARMTSSVTLVGTPDDFLGHETQTTASSAIFWRSDCKCFSNAPRSVTKRCTNFVFPTGRVPKFTPLGMLPSRLR